MEVIERWLLQQMEAMGVDSLKTQAGTPYKSISKSVKMQDPEQFKKFVFTPLIEYMTETGTIRDGEVLEVLTNNVLWDMIDFRCGKKGVEEYVAETGQLPPGVEMSSFTTVNIRKA